jgi:hypothetical protein
MYISLLDKILLKKGPKLDLLEVFDKVYTNYLANGSGLSVAPRDSDFQQRLVYSFMRSHVFGYHYPKFKDRIIVPDNYKDVMKKIFRDESEETLSGNELECFTEQKKAREDKQENMKAFMVDKLNEATENKTGVDLYSVLDNIYRMYTLEVLRNGDVFPDEDERGIWRYARVMIFMAGNPNENANLVISREYIEKYKTLFPGQKMFPEELVLAQRALMPPPQPRQPSSSSSSSSSLSSPLSYSVPQSSTSVLPATAPLPVSSLPVNPVVSVSSQPAPGPLPLPRISSLPELPVAPNTYASLSSSSSSSPAYPLGSYDHQLSSMLGSDYVNQHPLSPSDMEFRDSSYSTVAGHTDQAGGDTVSDYLSMDTLPSKESSTGRFGRLSRYYPIETLNTRSTALTPAAKPRIPRRS